MRHDRRLAPSKQNSQYFRRDTLEQRAACAVGLAAGVLDASGHRAMAAVGHRGAPMSPSMRPHTRRLIDHDVRWHSGETAGSRACIVAADTTRLAAAVLSNCILAIEDNARRLLDSRA